MEAGGKDGVGVMKYDEDDDDDDDEGDESDDGDNDGDNDDDDDAEDNDDVDDSILPKIGDNKIVYHEKIHHLEIFNNIKN